MVDRYREFLGLYEPGGVVWDKDGDYVEHSDYAALLAERDALAAQVEAMKAASPSPTCDVGHAHFTPFYLLANARRICSRSYMRNANWVLAMKLFAVGSTSAKRICIEADIDPDATSIKRAARQEPKT